MAKIKYLIFVFICKISCSMAQEAVHNFGNLKIHDTGSIGFHHNVINDGITDDNLGLAGFYSTNTILISGAFRPIFYDMEVMVIDNLFLEVGIGVTNNSNYVLGDIITPRNLLDVHVDYIDNAFYNGETDVTKVDGYSALTNKTQFTFPIGDDNRLRPLGITGETTINNAKSAYFFENPNNPSTFLTSFNTEERTDILTAVSTKEFWDVDTAIPATVQLTWDAQSEVGLLVEAIEDLLVVGWHTQNGVWENLGNTSFNGDFNDGYINSDVFVPDDYSVVTLGGSLNIKNIDLANYIITPNNDGINDFLVIKEVSISPDNTLSIYNRWGRKVYEAENYDNSFEGIANAGVIVNRGKILPAGVYFYIINLRDIDVVHQGYMYINE